MVTLEKINDVNKRDGKLMEKKTNKIYNDAIVS
jgi:hypothetical protein